MIEIDVSAEIAEKYELQLGVVVATNVNNTGDIPEELLEEGISTAKKIRMENGSNEALLTRKEIAIWREIYKGFKTKASKYNPTVEALMKRLIKGHELPAISKAVNAYFIPELNYLIPMGGYDLSKIRGKITLRTSDGDERFVGLDGAESFTYSDEVIYAEDDKVLTRRWNFRDAQFSAIDQNTNQLILISENPLDLYNESMANMIEETANNLQKYCQATTLTFQLSKEDIKNGQITIQAS